jgi:hypothetical protein
MSAIPESMSEVFAGWGFDDEGLLVDPGGNKYLPSDLMTTYWMRQAWAERAGGFPGEIAFMRSVLQDRIREASFALVVEVHQERPGGERVLMGSLRIGGSVPRQPEPLARAA